MTDGLSLPSDTSFNSAAMRKIPISAVRLGFPGAKKISRRSGVLLFDTGGGRTRGRLTKEGGLPVRPIAEPRARKGSNNSVRGRLDGRRHAPPASHRVVGGPVRELFRLQGRAQCQRRVPRGSRDDVQEELRSSAGRGTSGGVSRKATGQRAVKQGDCTARECRLARLL